MAVQTTTIDPRHEEFFTALAHVPHLVLSMTSGDACAINVHGRVALHRKEWPAISLPARMSSHREDMLALIPLASADAPTTTFERTTTDEPLVHLHVDWRLVTHVKIEVEPWPKNRIGCDAKIVLGPQTPAFAFFASRKHLDPVARWGYDEWRSL